MKKNKSTAQAERILVALLEHGSAEKAALALQISPTTVWRWLKKPEFQEQYRQARRQAYGRTIGRLQHAAEAAVSTLLRVLLDKDAPVNSRVRAAECVLKRGNGFDLENLQARVERLEEAREEPAEDFYPDDEVEGSPAESSRRTGTTSADVKLEKIVLGVLEHGTPEKAARALAMSASTVRRWCGKAEFQREYSRVRRQAFGRALARLQHAADAAASTLLRIMVDPKTPAACRVRAAAMVLECGDFALQDDLRARVDQLKEARQSER